MKKQTASFQENIRNTFIAYSLVPAFVVICLGLIIFVFAWRYSVVHMTYENNQDICRQLADLGTEYQKTLQNMEEYLLDAMEHDGLRLTAEGLTGKRQSDLYEQVYAVERNTGGESRFYLLNGQQEILFATQNTIPSFLIKPEYLHWGVLEQLQEQPQKVNYCLQDGMMCIGKALYEEGLLRGYLIFAISKNELIDTLGLKNQQIILTDARGWIFYTNHMGFVDDLGKIEQNIRSANGFLKLENTQYYVNQTSVLDGEMDVYTISDMQMRSNMILIIVAVVGVVFLAIGVITYWSTGQMAVKYTQDIDEIADAFEQVQKGILDIHLQIDSSSEFQAIGKDFNLMLKSLKQQIQRNEELAQRVAFAQVKQLESQFNPHFLFNTLDNIRFMCKIDANAADKMIVSLSRLLRYSIRDVREEIAVREDFDNLQSYLNILKIRFNKRFTYEIDIEERIMDCLIPKLLIQPLLENAIKYGFAGRETLHVIIRGYEKQDKLIFICKDNGAGIEKTLLEEIIQDLEEENHTGTHLGMYNIHRRIKLLYGGEYGLRIYSKAGEGATVVLALPYRQALTEENGRGQNA